MAPDKHMGDSAQRLGQLKLSCLIVALKARQYLRSLLRIE